MTILEYLYWYLMSFIIYMVLSVKWPYHRGSWREPAPWTGVARDSTQLLRGLHGNRRANRVLALPTWKVRAMFQQKAWALWQPRPQPPWLLTAGAFMPSRWDMHPPKAKDKAHCQPRQVNIMEQTPDVCQPVSRGSQVTSACSQTACCSHSTSGSYLQSLNSESPWHIFIFIYLFIYFLLVGG